MQPRSALTPSSCCPPIPSSGRRLVGRHRHLLRHAGAPGGGPAAARGWLGWDARSTRPSAQPPAHMTATPPAAVPSQPPTHLPSATPLPPLCQVDEYAWENPDFLPVFAAGNDGGKAKPGTMASPAGASRNGAGGREGREGGGARGSSRRVGTGPGPAPAAPLCRLFRVTTRLSSLPAPCPAPPPRRLHRDLACQLQKLPVCGSHAGGRAGGCQRSV